MSRSKGDGKIALGYDWRDHEGRSQEEWITPPEWKVLEQKLKASIPEHVKEAIKSVSRLFATLGRVTKRSPKVKKVIPKIRNWKNQSRSIVRMTLGTEVLRHKSKLERDEILRVHFDLKRLQRIPDDEPLRLLANVIDGAIAIAEYVEQELSNPLYKSPRDLRAFWFFWVDTVRYYVQSVGIKATASTDTDKQTKQSPFVEFIALLREKNCVHYHRPHLRATIAVGNGNHENNSIAFPPIELQLGEGLRASRRIRGNTRGIHD